ncbi:MAG: nucleotide sugar dehydrogenase [Albidovulum sp.]|uniref:nucleotide sugar dehydrogenase n=1 Tax=Albidovulum sp. TaxID=1872424 RepID=UPI003C8516E6
MKIAVFGLGYVGIVSAACLARDGHQVIGVDPQPTKVDLVNGGQPPIIEKNVGEMVAEAVKTGALRATTSAAEAVAFADLSLVCVGTPSRKNGSLETGAVERVCEEIGAAVGAKGRDHLVVIRSTILPGTMRGVVIPALTGAAGDGAKHLKVANNPEFLRESTAVYDYDNPPKTVVGSDDPDTAQAVLSLYADLPGPKIATKLEIGEMVKYADNAWHAVKVSFANEIGNIAQAVGVDSWDVMDIFCQDTKLNISPYYMKPGFAFGGSCLPKDVRALTFKGRDLDLDLPLLNSVLSTNAEQVERAIEMVADYGLRNISFMGISFKAGTDDLRESPLVTLVERLIGKGFNLKIYDRNVHLSRLLGANRAYIEGAIPHIAEILSDDLDTVLGHGDLVIVGNPAPEFKFIGAKVRADQKVLDLARISGLGAELGERYRGINW